MTKIRGSSTVKSNRRKSTETWEASVVSRDDQCKWERRGNQLYCELMHCSNKNRENQIKVRKGNYSCTLKVACETGHRRVYMSSAPYLLRWKTANSENSTEKNSWKFESCKCTLQRTIIERCASKTSRHISSRCQCRNADKRLEK